MAPVKAAATKAEPTGSATPGRQGTGAEARGSTKLKPLSRSSRSVLGSAPSRSTAAPSGRSALAGSAGRTCCPTAPRSVAWSARVAHLVEVRTQGEGAAK